MTHQTAVEWLKDILGDYGYTRVDIDWKTLDKFFEQAKAMEKEQMKDAVLAQSTGHNGLRKIFDNQFEQYYNDTFVGD